MANTKEAVHTIDTSEQDFNRRVTDIVLRLSALALTLYFCFQIIKPFVLIVLWGAIMAIALYPLHTKLSALLKGRQKLASIIIAIVGIALIAIPAVNLSSSSIESAQYLYQNFENDTLKIPSANASVKEWPLIGVPLYEFWQSASEDLEKVASQYSEQLKNLSAILLSGVIGISTSILQFIISLIIAVVFMTKSTACHQGISTLMHRLMGVNGSRTIKTTIATIRSVATGVLGVAAIQSLLSGIGLLVAGIPGAGIWAIVVLMLAIAQLPPILILGPIAAYYFSVADTTPAVIFLIFSILISMSDAALKPLFLGRGMDIPMLVILLGAIGGMLFAGIIGLFVGAVALALGYQLMMDWLAQTK